MRLCDRMAEVERPQNKTICAAKVSCMFYLVVDKLDHPFFAAWFAAALTLVWISQSMEFHDRSWKNKSIAFFVNGLESLVQHFNFHHLLVQLIH